MFTNARLFTIDKFFNARFDCDRLVLIMPDDFKTAENLLMLQPGYDCKAN